MVTRTIPPKLYLKEHREAKGISAQDMADILGIERESVYRLEREALTRANGQRLLQYAKAFKINPQDLWRPPGGPPSIDAMVATAPEEIQILAADIVSRLLAGRH
jgi:predicted transcriptional regulator